MAGRRPVLGHEIGHTEVGKRQEARGKRRGEGKRQEAKGKRQKKKPVPGSARGRLAIEALC